MVETVFENRFQHLEERCAAWACILRLSDTALVLLVEPLRRAEVLSQLIRASAALILTGLVAHRETVVGKLVHLDRGYYSVSMKLAQLGAKIHSG